MTVLASGCKETPDASLLDVSVGDCLDGKQADENHAVKTVPCDDSHAEYKVTAAIPSDDDKEKACPSVPDDLSADLSVAERNSEGQWFNICTKLVRPISSSSGE